MGLECRNNSKLSNKIPVDYGRNWFRDMHWTPFTVELLTPPLTPFRWTKKSGCAAGSFRLRRPDCYCKLLLNFGYCIFRIDPDMPNICQIHLPWWNKHADAKAICLDGSKFPNQGLQPVADHSSNTRRVESRKSGPTAETCETRQPILSPDNSPFPSIEYPWGLATPDIYSPPEPSRPLSWLPKSAQHLAS